MNCVLRKGEPTRIRLDHKLMDWVATGEKTSTIRRGVKPYTLGPAVMADHYGNSVRILITELQLTSFDCLTREDARSEGYDSLAELHTAIKGYYPDLAPHEELTVVRFMVEGTPE